jgi:hypothetical protein
MESITQVNIREVMFLCPELRFGPQVNVTESICFIQGIQYVKYIRKTRAARREYIDYKVGKSL